MKILHGVNLTRPFGSENNVSRFFHRTPEGAEHHFLDIGEKAHSKFREPLSSAASYHRWKYALGIKMPKFSRGLVNRRRLPEPSFDGVILHRCFDRRPGFRRFLLEKVPGSNLFWDHDTAWIRPASDEEWWRPYRGFLTVSHASREMLRQKFSVDKDRIRVVPNTLHDRFLAGLTQSRGDVAPTGSGGELRLLFVGRLAPEKGVNVLLRALGKLDSGTLTIVGDGPERSSLESLAADLGLSERVCFAGCQPDPIPYYRTCGVVIIPSLREPSGNVPLEAGAAGKPVIAAKVDGIPEQFEAGKHGLLVSPSLPLERYGEDLAASDFPERVFDPDEERLVVPRWIDPEDLAGAIRWLARRPGRRREMGDAYRRFVLNRFRPERGRKALKQALGDLLPPSEPDGGSTRAGRRLA